jgi:hypothetical protein
MFDGIKYQGLTAGRELGGEEDEEDSDEHGNRHTEHGINDDVWLSIEGGEDVAVH